MNGKLTKIMHPEEFAVCMGMDAMRLCLGQKPRHFATEDVIRWLRLMSGETR